MLRRFKPPDGAELLDGLAVVMAEQDLTEVPARRAGPQSFGGISADVGVTAAIEPSIVDSFIESMRQHGFDLASE